MMFAVSKIVRYLVLGLMCFLAVTAACSTDSYDPDPYDNVPPIVSVEFSYVVPSRVSIRRPSAQARNRQQAIMAISAGVVVPPTALSFEAFPATLAFGQGSPESISPLRL